MGKDGTTSRQRTLFEDYDGFVKKFEPKKTTDDCYTPPAVYDAVLAWARAEYGIADDVPIIRPFRPGGDYVSEDYPDGCLVLDNPPFSIFAEIVRFYTERGVRFLLFAPALTCMHTEGCCKLCTGAKVTYENGAVVNTSFVTNLDPHEARSAPALRDAVETANAAGEKKTMPRYSYPPEVLMANDLHKMSAAGVEFAVNPAECCRYAALDAQRAVGKSLFGWGLLLSERATAERVAAERAAERAAAERAAAERSTVWELSPREREMVKMLGSGAARRGQTAMF